MHQPDRGGSPAVEPVARPKSTKPPSPLGKRRPARPVPSAAEDTTPTDSEDATSAPSTSTSTTTREERAGAGDEGERRPGDGSGSGPGTGPGGGRGGGSGRTKIAGPPRRGVTLARVLAGFGRTLIAAGLIILLFAAYQLWGTGIHERRAQNDLENQFSDVLTAASQLDLTSLLTTTSSTAPATPEAPPPPPPTVPKELAELLYPADGLPVALIEIPRIGVNKVVVEGTAIEDLKNGPGHFIETPLPGQAGNAAIAGHRTTYGAPFGDIDQLEVGDEIRVTTILGTAVYKVAGQRIVDPSQVEVVGDFGDNRLTLTACHPKYSAAKRIVVWGMLEGAPFPTVPKPTDRVTVELPGEAPSTETTAAPTTEAPETTAPEVTTTVPTTVPTTAAPTTTAPTSLDGDGQGLSGDPDAWPPTLAWAGVCAAIALVAWFVGRQWERRSGRSWVRRYAVYVAVSPFFAGALYSCFVHVDRLLPAY